MWVLQFYLHNFSNHREYSQPVIRAFRLIPQLVKVDFPEILHVQMAGCLKEPNESIHRALPHKMRTRFWELIKRDGLGKKEEKENKKKLANMHGRIIRKKALLCYNHSS